MKMLLALITFYATSSFSKENLVGEKVYPSIIRYSYSIKKISKILKKDHVISCNRSGAFEKSKGNCKLAIPVKFDYLGNQFLPTYSMFTGLSGGLSEFLFHKYLNSNFIEADESGISEILWSVDDSNYILSVSFQDKDLISETDESFAKLAEAKIVNLFKASIEEGHYNFDVKNDHFFYLISKGKVKNISESRQKEIVK